MLACVLHYLIYTKTTFNEKQGARTWRANETETIVQMCKVKTTVLDTGCTEPLSTGDEVE